MRSRTLIQNGPNQGGICVLRSIPDKFILLLRARDGIRAFPGVRSVAHKSTRPALNMFGGLGYIGIKDVIRGDREEGRVVVSFIGITF